MWKTGQFFRSVLLRRSSGCWGPHDATNKGSSSHNATGIIVTPLLEETIDLILSLPALHKHCLELLALLVEQDDFCKMRWSKMDRVASCKLDMTVPGLSEFISLSRYLENALAFLRLPTRSLCCSSYCCNLF